MSTIRPAAIAAVLAAFATDAVASELNLYSSRHYSSDAELYAGFEEATGVKVNLIEGKADELIARIIQEGEASPADVLLTVDAGRLWRAEEAGVLAPFAPDLIAERLPENMRHPDNLWLGVAMRARLIYRANDAEPVLSYEDLADPKHQGEICIRTSSNIYNLSLVASLIEHHGEEATTQWIEGLVGNLARDPEGGDTDQIRAVAAGACKYAVGNHYYYARLQGSEDPADQEVVAAVTPILPNQDGRGAHINISGAAIVAGAPNADNAQAFIEYLLSDEAQTLLATGNNEIPVVEGVVVDHAGAAMLEGLEVDTINLSILGENQTRAQMLSDLAGWR